MTKNKRVLHLFSSNSRQLYIQNCVNLMALPKGATVRFRYRKELLDDDLLWNANLKGSEVFTYFASTVRDDPSEIRLVPLRVCELIKLTSRGDFYFLDLKIGDYLDIADVNNLLSLNQTDQIDDDEEELLQDFTLKLQNELQLIPHKINDDGNWITAGKFAVIGSHKIFDSSKMKEIDQEIKFTKTARYILETNAHTSSEYKIQSVYKVIEIVEISDNSEISTQAIPYLDGYKFESNKRYLIEIFQIKDELPGTPTLSLKLPDLLSATTPLDVHLASNYDLVSFEFIANPRDNESRSYISFIGKLDDVSAVDEGLILARITLPILVVPPQKLHGQSMMAIFGSSILAGLVAFSSSHSFTLFSNQREFGRHYEFESHQMHNWFINHSPAIVITLLATGAAYTTANFAFRRRSIGLKD